MKNILWLLLLMSCVSTASGCTQMTKREQATLSGGAGGVAVGAGIGALSGGSWVVGGAIGGVLGGVVGNIYSYSADKAEDAED